MRHAPPFFPDERVIGETHTYLRLRRKLRFHIHLLRILNSVAEFLSGTDGIESDSEEEDLELVLETLLEGVRRQRRMSGTPPRADVSNGQEPRETLIRFLVARFTAGLRVAIPVVEEFPSQSELDAAYDVGTSLGRAVRERHRGRLEDGLNAALGQGLHSSSSGEQQQPQQPEGVSEPEPTPGVAQQTAGPASDEVLFSLGGVPKVLPAPKAKPKPKAKVAPTSPTPTPVNPNDDPPNPSTVPVPPSFPLNVSPGRLPWWERKKDRDPHYFAGGRKEGGHVRCPFAIQEPGGLRLECMHSIRPSRHRDCLAHRTELEGEECPHHPNIGKDHC